MVDVAKQLRRTVGRFLLVAGAALLAGPALAYTIFLKDGSQILAKEKYQVQGRMAIITQLSGTKTSFPLSEIDIERTEKANVQDLGTAILIEDGRATDLGQAAAPPPKPQLGDLIQRGSAGPGAAGEAVAGESARRPDGFDARSEAVAQPQRAPYPDHEVAASIRERAATQGLPVTVARGSKARRPLLVFETETEANVFRALLTAATALEELRKDQPGKVEAVEVLCQTSSGSAGGRFTLSPAQASELLSGRADLTRFYCENVEF